MTLDVLAAIVEGWTEEQVQQVKARKAAQRAQK